MDTRISDKLARSGHTLDVISKVLAVLCIVAAVLSFIGAIAILLLPDDLILRVLSIIPVANRMFNAADGITIAGFVSTAAMIALKFVVLAATIGFCVYCLLGAFVLYILSSIFKATAVHRTPFLQENVKRLKAVGIIMIFASIVLGLHNFIFAFCVFALAYVIQYGVELQQQSDETL
ncbi:MAG: hypothetical protein FWD45_03600 [Coriobacteriia bacterium]|nr:hypothetical protein [Coriobacteriia bacterium]